MTGLGVATAIAANDLRLELRRPLMLVGVVLFSAASLVTLHLAIAGSGAATPRAAAGALWIVLIYGMLLGAGRVLTSEHEQQTWDGLLLTTADRTWIYIGKVCAAAGLMIVVHTCVLALFLVMFPLVDGPASIARLALTVLLADIGCALVAVLLGAVALRARGRELVTAAAFIPLCMPLVIAGVASSAAILGPDSAASPGTFGFLLLYDGVFAALGLGLFAELCVD